MGHHRLLAGVETGFGGEIFRGIGCGPARQALIVVPAGGEHHQPRRLQFHPVLRQRMLDCLVHADRTVEDVAALRIGRRLRERHLAQPYRFRCDQDALRIHAVQDIFEAAAFFAQAILDRNLEILEEQLVGIDGLAAHLLDLVHGDPLAIEIGVEQAQALRRRLHLLQRRGARQQQDLLRDLRGRDPDLLAADDVFVVLAHRAGLQLRGVEPGIRLGDRKAGFFLALDDRWQHALALLPGAEHHHRVKPEHVHVHGGRAGHTGAGFRDRAHHDRGIGDAEPRAAIFFGNADTEPPGIGHRLVEIGRKAALFVLLQPIGIVETRADLADGITDRFLIG